MARGRDGGRAYKWDWLRRLLALHPGRELGLNVATVREALVAELGATVEVVYEKGCDVRGSDTAGDVQALLAANESDIVLAVMGDIAGLFGRGTSGEGCDADSLELPGVQRQLVEQLLATGKPVILVLLTGRPYAVGWAIERCAAVVTSLFPGQEGAQAMVGVLSGRINPSGRLPVSLPRSAGAQPYSYLHPRLGAVSSVSNLDTAPVLPFGHGLSYTSFGYTDLRLSEDAVLTGAAFTATVRVRNTGGRAGADIVQLYGQDVFASVTRPVVQLLGYAQVHLDAGENADATFDVPTTRFAFSDRRMVRVVEPGLVDVSAGASCAELALTESITLTGEVYEVGIQDRRQVGVSVREFAGE